MIIVSDTSPISALYRIHQIHLLEKLFECVIIPQKVMEELQQLNKWGYNIEYDFAALTWIEVKVVQDSPYLQQLLLLLDEGEAHAIVLAKELNVHRLIIDEIKGRTIAQQEGLEIVGVLGILLQAKKEGFIDNMKSVLDDLIYQTKFRISKDLYNEILKKVGEM